MGAAFLNHTHVSSGVNGDLLTNATRVAPIAPKICTGWFSTCWIQICNQICSLTTQGIQALMIQVFSDWQECLFLWCRFFYTKAGQDISVGAYWNDPHHQNKFADPKLDVLLARLNNQTCHDTSQGNCNIFMRFEYYCHALIWIVELKYHINSFRGVVSPCTVLNKIKLMYKDLWRG